jgi:hypothetical protein
MILPVYGIRTVIGNRAGTLEAGQLGRMNSRLRGNNHTKSACSDCRLQADLGHPADVGNPADPAIR